MSIWLDRFNCSWSMFTAYHGGCAIRSCWWKEKNIIERRVTERESDTRTHIQTWNKKNHRKSHENGVSIFWCMCEIKRSFSLFMYAIYLLVGKMFRPLLCMFVSVSHSHSLLVAAIHIYFITFRFAHILSGHSHCLLSLSPSNEMYVRACKYISELLFLLCVVLFPYDSQCYALPSSVSLFSF